MTNTTFEDRRGLPETVQLLEEDATVSVRAVTTGRVRVATHVETFQQIAQAELSSDAVDVTRVAIDQPITGDLPQVRTEGDTTIVPVFEEILVVEKRLFLKEELHIRKRTKTETVELPVTLRRQTAEIERVEGDSGA